MITQEQIESMFSQRNIHDLLHRSIQYELDKSLETWTLGAYLRVNEYLNGDYYPSKQDRVDELREYVEIYGLESILIALFAGVIRAKQDSTLQRVVGYLQSWIPHEDPFDRARTAGELIAICGGKHRTFEIVRHDRHESPVVQVNYWRDIKDIFKEAFEFIEDTFFNPPMICKPKKVKTRHNCGYHTINEPVILGQFTQHEDNLDYETLNILNQIPWKLDPEVLCEPEEPPKDLETTDQILDFHAHCRISNRIYDILEDRTFYLGWQVDSRGRLYSHGHHVNLQSYEYKKALLNHDYSAVATQ